MENIRNEKNSYGWIEVICGPMFSGKTEELLRRLRRARFAQIDLAIFKPETDSRYHPTRIVSHDANYFPSLSVANAESILKHKGNAKIIAIDEAQFFDENLVMVVSKLANEGRRIIITGLDKDYLGRPFGLMPQLITIAEYVTKLSAVCMQCGDTAFFSHRKTAKSGVILTGSYEDYEPRCRKCFYQENELIL
jgi:thymidine kinase